MSRDAKDKKKGFYKHIGVRRKTGECMGPLLNELNNLITQDMKKAEVLNVASQECQVLETRGRGWNKENMFFKEENRLRLMAIYVSKLDVNKFMSPDGLHP